MEKVLMLCRKVIQDFEGWDWDKETKDLLQSIKENIYTSNIEALTNQFRLLLCELKDIEGSEEETADVITLIFELEKVKREINQTNLF